MDSPDRALHRTYAAGQETCSLGRSTPMTTSRSLLAIMGILSLLFGGCSKRPASQTPVNPSAPILKIAVLADGRLTVDGAPSTVPALRESLRRLSEQHGAVWYYR